MGNRIIICPIDKDRACQTSCKANKDGKCMLLELVSVLNDSLKFVIKLARDEVKNR